MSRLLALIIIVFLPWHLYAQKNAATLQQEDKAYAALEALPEVQQMIRNDTDKVWHLIMRTVRYPSANFKYYWIEVGHTNNQRMETQFHFYVKPPAMDVYYLDAQMDSLFTPSQWRARGK